MTDFPKVPEGILGEDTVEKTNTELFLSLVGQYFPEAIKDGEVDFTALKEEMGEFPQVSSEHYEFTWAGKQAAKKEAMSDIYGRTLKYKPQDSLNPDTTENIYIEGDNLEALKLLRRNYHGKIKMIYIDPPYNTGSDFVYRDNFTMKEEEIAELSGDTNNGDRLQKVTKDDAKYHTKWLNMMYPRLKIARELLKEDGIILVSIGEDEISSLLTLMDSIFNANNRVCTFVWKSRAKPTNAGNARFRPQKVSEYVLVYSKINPEQLIHNVIPAKERTYPHSDEFGNFRTTTILTSNRGTFRRETMRFESHGFTPNEDFRWKAGKSTIDKLYETNHMYINDDGIPMEKKYAHEESDPLYPIYTFMDTDLSATAEKGKAELAELVGNKHGFDTVKPIELIKYFIQTFSNKDDIIMDFFSGSGTTAQACFEQNAEDNGSRVFILVQFPVYYDEKSEAVKAGYRTICEIGKERIRRAAKKIHEDNPDAQFDDGFKVFEVADTNIKWNTADDEEIQKLDETDYGNDKERIDFTKGYTDIDVVYEIMLRQFDIPFSTPIEKLTQVSDRTYIFADAVVVCLEPEITTELIEKLAAIEPTPAKFVLRDSAFNDDIQLKDVSFRRLSALIKNHQTEEERKSKYNNYTVEFI